MIREATESDLPELMRMAFAFHKAGRFRRYATFEESTEHWYNWFRQCIHAPIAVCLVSEEKPRKLNGFATVLISPFYWNFNIFGAQEATFWVEPNHRKNGVGSGLLDAMIAWAKDHGVRVFTASSYVSLAPKVMSEFLRNRGFELKERLYVKEL